MSKFVLLDRDGVINIERGEYTFKPSDFKLVPGLIEGMIELKKLGYRFAVISNQGGIAKGLYTLKEVRQLESIFINTLLEADVEVSDFYYCPHHPDFGKCLCRKPSKLLFEKVSAKYSINTHESFMIGDKERDVLPAKELGFKTLQIQANTNFLNVVEYIRSHG